MNRENPEGPVLAVGGVILSARKLLLVKRAKEPDLGKWSIPGGGVEAGETIYEALVREILEECSIRVLSAEPFLIVERIFEENGMVKYHYFIVDFLVQSYEGEPEASSDADECRFFSFDELRGLNASRSIENIENLIDDHLKTGRIIVLSSKQSI